MVCIELISEFSKVLLAWCSYLSQLTENNILVMCTFAVNPIALRKAKIVNNFGLSECIRLKKDCSTIWLQSCSFSVRCKPIQNLRNSF